MRPKRKSLALCILIAIVITSFLTQAWFREAVLVTLGQALVRSDSLQQADVIYVLAGDFWGNRVLLGADLGVSGYGRTVILSGGAYKNTYASDMAVDFAVEHGYPRNMFSPVRLTAASTIEEARAMGPIFRRIGAKRIILVTSNFHSRRAGLVFRLFLPDLHFQMAASQETNFDPRSWWKNKEGRHLCSSEFQKLAGTLVFRAAMAFRN